MNAEDERWIEEQLERARNYRRWVNRLGYNVPEVKSPAHARAVAAWEQARVAAWSRFKYEPTQRDQWRAMHPRP